MDDLLLIFFFFSFLILTMLIYGDRMLYIIVGRIRDKYNTILICNTFFLYIKNNGYICINNKC